MRATPQPAGPACAHPGRWHLHRFRWSAEVTTGNGSVYTCRCGAVRPGI